MKLTSEQISILKCLRAQVENAQIDGDNLTETAAGAYEDVLGMIDELLVRSEDDAK